jgi:hypothetical protein
MDEAVGCPGCQRLQARVAELEALVRDLAAQVKDLTARLQNKEPPPRPPAGPTAAPAKTPTGRRPGGQLGHPPHLKRRLTPDLVTATVTYVPTTCEQCRTDLSAAAGPNDPDPTWHQVVELPPVLATVTEHQGHARTCPDCGHVTRAAIPAAVRAHTVGPRLTGVLGYLTGDQGLSKRGVEELVEQVFGVPIGLGTVSNLEQELSTALAAAHTQATAAVRDAPVKHVDETGWKEAGKKQWLWLAATKLVAVFVIHPYRNLSALKALLGRELTGILCSDRWVVYDDWPDPFARQLCWAHLKRNWEALVERGGAADRRAVPGGPDVGLRVVAPVPGRGLHPGRTGRPNAPVGGRDGSRADRRAAVSGRPDAAVLCAAGPGEVRAVDVCGSRRGRADEQPRGAGPAAGGAVAAAVVRVSQRRRVSVRRAPSDGGRNPPTPGPKCGGLPG